MAEEEIKGHYDIEGNIVPDYTGTRDPDAVESGDVSPSTIRFSLDITHGIMIEIYGLDITNTNGPISTNLINQMFSATGKDISDGNNFLGNPIPQSYVNTTKTAGGNVVQSTAENLNGAINGKQKTRVYLYLPLPNDINFSYNASWGAENLSLTQYEVRKWMKSGGGMESLFSIIGEGVAIGAMKGLLGRTVGLGPVRAGGLVFNPYKQLMYDSPDFRTFSFNWMLSPKNANESVNLNKIIWYLKKHMHPSTTGVKGGNGPELENNWLWLTPDFVNMTFMTSDDSNASNPWIPLIKEAVITGIGVQIDPKFHTGDNAPTTISLTMNIMETKLYSQEDFGKTYNLTANI